MTIRGPVPSSGACTFHLARGGDHPHRHRRAVPGPLAPGVRLPAAPYPRPHLAEDLAQETFVKATRALLGRCGGSPAAWLLSRAVLARLSEAMNALVVVEGLPPGLLNRMCLWHTLRTMDSERVPSIEETDEYWGSEKAGEDGEVDENEDQDGSDTLSEYPRPRPAQLREADLLTGPSTTVQVRWRRFDLSSPLPPGVGLEGSQSARKNPLIQDDGDRDNLFGQWVARWRHTASAE